jgi:hypothetical protein
VIPYKVTAKTRPAFFPKALYRARARIEQLVGKLKSIFDTFDEHPASK